MQGSEYSPAGRPPARQGPSTLLVVILLVLVSLVAARFWFDRSPDLLDPDAAPRLVAARGELAADEQATIALFQAVSPSVVYITTSTLQRDFNFNVLEIPQGTGSGFIWDEQGHVVTNFHVVEGATRLRVMLADQTTKDAVLVGAAPDKDLAVLKIEDVSRDLPAILIGSSNDLQVGQKVFAIGNPFGLDQTLTTGIISGLGRQIPARNMANRVIEGVIQTDAAINPGNSGGPLLDSAARLIGMNTAIVSPTGASAGIGFAIPIDSINRLVPEILRHGRVVRPGLGVFLANEAISRQLNLPGPLVVAFPDDSAAAEAGMVPTRYDRAGNLRLGDVILRINGEQVANESQLQDVLQEHEVGDTVTVTVLRGARTQQAEEIELSITLQAVN